MQLLSHPLLHIGLGATGLICTGLLVKDIWAMKRALHLETSGSKAKPKEKNRLQQVYQIFK
jgi:hypothetical protein